MFTLRNFVISECHIFRIEARIAPIIFIGVCLMYNGYVFHRRAQFGSILVRGSRDALYVNSTTLNQKVIIIIPISNMTILLILRIYNNDFMHMIPHYSARAYYDIVRRFPGRFCCRALCDTFRCYAVIMVHRAPRSRAGFHLCLALCCVWRYAVL